MGKHSVGDDRVFFKSIALTIAKWLALGALPIMAAIGIYRLVQNRQPDDRGGAITAVSPTASPTPSPSPSPSPSTSPSPEPSPTFSPVFGGRVQVLNGADDQTLGGKAETKLEDAGYNVIGPQRAARHFEETTVFFQPGEVDRARTVASVLGLGKVEPAPSNLDRSIPVTVVVGDDFTG